MRINDFYAIGFRNLKEISVSPSPQVNVIYGENGQGKTNLLEALWLFTGTKSFRSQGLGVRERDFINFDEKVATLQMFFTTAERQQNAKLVYPKDNIRSKKAWLNGVELGNTSKLFGSFRSVIFCPEHLSLVKGGPDGRRSFLDGAVSQIRKGYMRTLWQYNKILAQRNALLKEISYKRELTATLEMWDFQLAKAGTYITIQRLDYVNKLSKACREYYEGISQGREMLDISYCSTIFTGVQEPISYTESIVNHYFNKLQSSVKDDIKQGYTSYGIHRDDIACCLDKRPAKSFGSQGQQRSIVLSLKLSEAELLRAEFLDNPVILFDDVLSELDSSRQSFIMNNLGDMQVFITCCDPNSTQQLKQGAIFEVVNGKVLQTKNG